MRSRMFLDKKEWPPGAQYYWRLKPKDFADSKNLVPRSRHPKMESDHPDYIVLGDIVLAETSYGVGPT